MSTPTPLPPECYTYYETGREQHRLLNGRGKLELVRTQEIIQRFLPPPPAVILDIGGGPGHYSCWLAELGYEVHLIDAVPFLVEQASQASQRQPEYPISSCAVGDARRLAQSNGSADAVLLLGPLYHLTEREDRIAALREAYRVLRDGGLVFAVAISRFASAFDALFLGYLDDPGFAGIVKQDLIDGQHRNPTRKQGYFTTAFLHRPEELTAEVEESGFRQEGLLAIQGPAGLLQNLDEHWDDPARRDRLLDLIRLIESEPSLLGVSSHIIAVGRKET